MRVSHATLVLYSVATTTATKQTRLPIHEAVHLYEITVALKCCCRERTLHSAYEATGLSIHGKELCHGMSELE